MHMLVSMFIITAIGKRVRVVNGRHRGRTAVMLALDADRFSVELELEPSSTGQRAVVKGVPYEHVSKLADDA